MRRGEKNPEIRPSAELPLFAEQSFYKFEQTHSALPEIEKATNRQVNRRAEDIKRDISAQSHGEQTKSCLTAPLSANGESGDCRSLSGTGSPRDESATSGVRGFAAPAENRVLRESKLESRVSNSLSPVVARARRSDPIQSHKAAASVVNLGRTKDAIINCLYIRPRTDEEIAEFFQRFVPFKVSPSGLRSRRAWLVQNGFVEACGTAKTVSGRECQIWRLK